MNSHYLRASLSSVLGSLAFAQGALASTLAQITGSQGLDLRWDVMLLSFVICTVSGVAALLQRINAELTKNPERPLPHPILFCASHMVGSWAAGLAAFIVGQQFGFEAWTALSLMMTASYMGARWLEAWAEGRLPKAQQPPQEAP